MSALQTDDAMPTPPHRPEDHTETPGKVYILEHSEYHEIRDHYHVLSVHSTRHKATHALLEHSLTEYNGTLRTGEVLDRVDFAQYNNNLNDILYKSYDKAIEAARQGVSYVPCVIHSLHPHYRVKVYTIM